MDETVEAGSSTGMDRQNVITEPFGENASAARRRHATEAPRLEANADYTPGKRQIREPSLITAVNARRSQKAIRALSCRADSSRLDGRRHTVDRNPIDQKPGRNDCGRPQCSRHCADSFMKPTQVGASTASNASQSQICEPIDRLSGIAGVFNLWGTKPTPNGYGVGRGYVMTEQNRRTDPLAREVHQELPFTSLKQIGNEIRIKLARITAEPLPAELQALLLKLERKLELQRKRDGKQ